MVDFPDGSKKEPTLRLYYDDSYLTEFEAKIIMSLTYEGSPAVILDRTAFYPESGGQPFDTGTLGETSVINVIEDQETIIHVLDGDLKAEYVCGRINWPRRFDHMQQHTGQHILSQAFWEIAGGETAAFHLGEVRSTLEIKLATISDSDLIRIEQRANEIVWKDIEVKKYFVNEAKMGQIPFRRRPQKQGNLRVVEVAGYDFSACGGTHCHRTGEVGLIKIVGQEKIRGQVRFEFVCGGRALADYHRKTVEVKKIAGFFSTKDEKSYEAVMKLVEDNKHIRKRIKILEEGLLNYRAEEIAASTQSPVIFRVIDDLSPEAARKLALKIADKNTCYVLVGVKSERQGHLIFARHESLPVNLKDAISFISTKFQVKGGGGPTLVELVTPEKEKICLIIETAKKWLDEQNKP